MFCQCLKADCQALYITKNMLGILVRGNAPAPRKPEVQYDHENSYQTQIYSHQGPTKFQKKPLKE